MTFAQNYCWFVIILDNKAEISSLDNEKLLLQLMTLKTKARLKVGFGNVDKKLNDLILNTPIEDFQTFKKELGKYLRVLNEIK